MMGQTTTPSVLAITCIRSFLQARVKWHLTSLPSMMRRGMLPCRQCLQRGNLMSICTRDFLESSLEMQTKSSIGASDSVLGLAVDHRALTCGVRDEKHSCRQLS